MNDISIVMFLLIALTGLITFFLGCFELQNTIRKKQAPFIGIIYSLVSAICFFVLGIYWAVFAADASFIGAAYIWYALAWISVLTVVVESFLYIRYSMKQETKLSVTYTGP
jgi:hypothetical protein